MPHPDLETSRLLLRPVTPEDYQAVFRWCGDPKVNKYMIYPLYKSAEAVRAWLESKPVASPDEFDYGFVLKETGELIGEGGMFYHPEEGLWHIGYNLRSDLWGRGLTTEAMRAIIDYVCTAREVRVIEACHAVDNPASGAVIRKLGLTFDRDSQYSKLDGSETFPAKTYRWERKE
ncbi:MAG: GNAT family N-acetyltransferase [Clostridiales bacterium]|nr:GNAT family N-acetyltransferase [Clostridiales bacterium]